MVFYVYILACFKERDFRCYYVGQTNNLQERMEEHFDNVREIATEHFTGRFNFVKPIWFIEVETRQDAIKLEKYLKSLTPPQKRDYMKKNGDWFRKFA